MNLVKFIKRKIRQIRLGKLPIPGESPEVNITRILRNPRSILIVPYNRMGAILLATRTFKAVRERYPQAKILVAVHAAWSVLIQNDPSIDEVLTYGDEINNPLSPEFRATGEMLASREFDLAFFLSYQYDLGTAYLTRLSNALLRVSFASDQPHDFFNIQIVPASGVRYEGERYLALLEILGIPGILRDYTMTISTAIREKARMKFLTGGADVRNTTFIGFDLTREMVGDPITRKQSETTVGALISELDATVILFFEPEKREIAGALKETFGKKVLPVEDRPVSTAAGLMSFCSFVVAHNTDLLQLAIALKIPVLGILNKNDMIQWSPGESDRIVHIERSDLSWPSAAIIGQTAKNLLKQRKQSESKSPRAEGSQGD
jgi:ADP-heptose:LPS heptosyltransferase